MSAKNHQKGSGNHRGADRESQRFDGDTDPGDNPDPDRRSPRAFLEPTKSSLMPLRAVLFDFDGVMADTENIHVAAWQRTFADLGWEVSDEVCARAAEEDDRAFLAAVFAERKIEGGDIAGWTGRKQALTIAMLRDAPRVYPGLAALVEAVRGRLRLGVVSGTWRANVEAVLGASGLRPAFDLIVGKEDAKEAKPAPDGY